MSLRKNGKKEKKGKRKTQNMKKKKQ